jgi:hypothetical protein
MSKTEQIFQAIYNKNFWGNVESVSGPGSTFVYTKNIRSEIPKLLDQLSINSILDGPCGDFNWMKSTLDFTRFRYTGVDIVPELIDKNRILYGSENISFIKKDLLKDDLPISDLMLCRDLLAHLALEDIYKFFSNFLRSQIPYLLTSTHVHLDIEKNHDIRSGDFRELNLEIPPFKFISEIRIDDWVAPFPPRQLILLTRDDVLKSL